MAATLPPFRMRPSSLGLGLVLAALLCFGLAALLLIYRLIAALIVAAALALVGIGLCGVGAMIWRMEARVRKRASGPPPGGNEIVRDAEAQWRDDAPPPGGGSH
jgi:hypothetical protein